MREYEEWRIFTRFPNEELRRRADAGLVARGRALVAPLLRACAALGVTPVTGCGVERPGTSHGAVTRAHPMGPGYPGAGATLGPGATMAYAAGLAAVRRLEVTTARG